jgi:D-arabinose 1-dehydrogenase-like Zn-dependent alcohol dehydrogenase
MPEKALAAVTVRPHVMEIRELDIPAIGDDEALVRIEACGICGTDYEWFRGDLRIAYPVILGHEPLGVIAAIGGEASRRWGVQVGDRVAVRSQHRLHTHSFPIEAAEQALKTLSGETGEAAIHVAIVPRSRK